MDSTDETMIELSRTKLLLLTLGSCAFVAAGAWLLSLDAAEVRAGRSFRLFFNDPTFAYGAGLASILFFGACGVYGIVKMFDRKPGLVLNSDGVVDNASGVAAGFIPWSEVLGAGVYEVQGRKMLIIGVRDPRKYIERGGALRRMLNKANNGMTGSPITIPSVTLKMNFSEVVSLFNRYQEKYAPAPGDGDDPNVREG